MSQAIWQDILGRWRPDFDPQLVALYRVGSHSHGTHVPPADPTGIDDTDYMAIVIPPHQRVLGFQAFDHATVKEGDLDCVIYSWSKYMGLLLKSNPNVIGTLWLDGEDVTVDRAYPAFKLREMRSIFASKRVHAAFAGYARAQMYKMTHQAFQGYMGEKRKRLVEQWGYDTKNAAHLIRLLRMCSEFLVSGEMVVRRPDATELIAIKRGEWSLQRVQMEAERLFALCDERVAASTLPAVPDSATAEFLMISAYWHAWGREYRQH